MPIITKPYETKDHQIKVQLKPKRSSTHVHSWSKFVPNHIFPNLFSISSCFSHHFPIMFIIIFPPHGRASPHFSQHFLFGSGKIMSFPWFSPDFSQIFPSKTPQVDPHGRHPWLGLGRRAAAGALRAAEAERALRADAAAQRGGPRRCHHVRVEMAGFVPKKGRNSQKSWCC